LKGWAVEPKSSDSGEIVSFKIHGKVNDYEIHINDNGECSLISPKPDRNVFDSQWYSPTLLLKMMAYYGYNISAPTSLEDASFLKRKVK
jgi:hypothetical protein